MGREEARLNFVVITNALAHDYQFVFDQHCRAALPTTADRDRIRAKVAPPRKKPPFFNPDNMI